jgi:hypothetical protein
VSIEWTVFRPERWQLPAFILVVGPLAVFFGWLAPGGSSALGIACVAVLCIAGWMAHPLFARTCVLRATHDRARDRLELELDGERLAFAPSQVKYIITVRNSDYPDDMYVVRRDKSRISVPHAPVDGQRLLAEAARQWGIRHVTRDVYDDDLHDSAQ